MAEINLILYVCKDLVCLHPINNKISELIRPNCFVYQMIPGKVSEFWLVKIKVFCLEKSQLQFFLTKLQNCLNPRNFFLNPRNFFLQNANKMVA